MGVRNEPRIVEIGYRSMGHVPILYVVVRRASRRRFNGVEYKYGVNAASYLKHVLTSMGLYRLAQKASRLPLSLASDVNVARVARMLREIADSLGAEVRIG